MRLLLNIFLLVTLSLPVSAQDEESKQIIFEDAKEPTYNFESGDSINIENISYKITRTQRSKNIFVIQNSSSKGVINNELSFILNPSNYKTIEFENYGIKVRKEDSFGLLDFDGKLLLPEEMKGIYPFFDDVIHYVQKDGRQKLYFLANGKQSDSDYCDIKGFSMDNNLVLLSQNCTDYGLMKLGSDQIEIEYKFQNPQYISTNQFKGWILSESSKYGILNTNEEIVIPFEYDEIYNIKNHFLVRQENKWGILDSKSVPVVPLKYKSVLPLRYENLFTVNLDGKYGLVDVSGNTLIPVVYDELSWQFNKKAFIATLNWKKGIITKANEIILPFEYDEIEDNWLNGYRVSTKDKQGVVSYEGAEIIPTIYHQINILRANAKFPDAGFHVLNENIKTAFFNISGEQKTDFVFDAYEIHGTRQPALVKIGETDFFVNALGVCVKDCPSNAFLKKYGLNKQK